MCHAHPVEVYVRREVGDREEDDLFDGDGLSLPIPRVPGKYDSIVGSPFLKPERSAGNVVAGRRPRRLMSPLPRGFDGLARNRSQKRLPQQSEER